MLFNVLCGVVTDVLVEDHIEEGRQWYVSGEGQLCLECADKGVY